MTFLRILYSSHIAPCDGDEIDVSWRGALQILEWMNEWMNQWMNEPISLYLTDTDKQTDK